MDWGRAKTILLYLFIILNVFLLTTLFITTSQKNTTKINAKATKEILESKGVVFNAQIPIEKGKLGRIEYKDNSDLIRKTVDRILIKENIQNNDKTFKRIEVDNNTSIEIDALGLLTYTNNELPVLIEMSEIGRRNEIIKIIKDIGFKVNGYIYDGIRNEVSKNIYSYIQKQRGRLLFNNALKVYVENNKIIKIEMLIREFANEGSMREIVTASQLLLTIKLENTIIENIELGYKPYTKEELIDSPVWRIKIQDGEIVYYNAYTGALVE